MKFALVGDDPLVLPLVRAIADRRDMTLSIAAMLGELEAEALTLCPAVRIVGGWEEMLAGDLDAVIVCGPAASIAGPAKQLAAAGQTLAVLANGAWDTELIYELSLLRDDTGVRLIPLCPLLELPDFRSEPVADGSEAVRVLHLRCDRELQIAAGGELDPEALRTHLLPDVGLLRRLGGEYHQVTAVRSTTPAGGIVQATVTLSGENLPDAVWTIRPTKGESRWQLTVARERDSAVYEQVGADPQFTRNGHPIAPAFEMGAAELAFIERSLADPETRPDWTDLTRDFEVLDAVRRSLAKRRTIDLHFETTSERSLFKTQMTAIGCGVLTLTFFAVVGLLLVGSLFDARDPVEIKAENAGTIFYAAEFEPDASQLTTEGQAHWDRARVERNDEAIPILVEQAETKDLSQERKEALVELLEEEGVPNAAQRVEIYDLAGPRFERIMKIARFLVFVPLFLFLGLQFLLVIARPAHAQRNSQELS